MDFKSLADREFEDNTDNIRRRKPSANLRRDLRTLNGLMESRADLLETDPDTFRALCESECFFLFDEQRFLFDSILKRTMSFSLGMDAIGCIEKIETGELTQFEASAEIGEIFVKVGMVNAQLEIENEKAKEKPKSKGKNISYTDWEKKNES